jgi:hypothetical protein
VKIRLTWALVQDWRGNGGGPNKNFTFDTVRVKDIGRENEVLLQKLQRIAVKGSGATGGKVSGEAKRRESSQEINRRRKEQEIARQNLMIANRLQNAKSATFDRSESHINSLHQFSAHPLST